MKICNKFSLRGLCGLLVAMIFTGLAVGCTEVDDTLGSDMIPNSQKMKIFSQTLSNGSDIATRLFRTDSVRSSQIGAGYFGEAQTDTFGLRKASFMTQYTWASTSHRKTWFGNRPIFDSLMLILSIKDYIGDTTAAQSFNVYEVTSNIMLDKKDSVFYANEDLSRYADTSEPLFTFSLPNAQGEAVSVRGVKLNPTAKGMSYVRRMMLLEGDYKGDTLVYNRDSLWLKYFKGLYIEPQSHSGKGAIYKTELASSGLALYARNRQEQDPTQIKDTVKVIYSFYIDKADYGNMSLNEVDYSNNGSSLIDYDAIHENNHNQVVTRNIYVEGMAGVITEIEFTRPFLEHLRDLRPAEAPYNEYTRLAVNQALIYIYIDGVKNSGWGQDFSGVINWFDYSPARLGMYLNFSTLTPIPDYNFSYEASTGTELSYGGYLNRSLGCYVMDISSYVQQLWNKCQQNADDLSKVQNKIYLAPEASDLYTFKAAALQGTGAESPVRVELTYTMLK